MIFVTGYPRSGTTLLSNKLSELADVFIGPETQFYRKAFFSLSKSKTNQEFLNEVINDKRLQDFGLSFDEMKSVCESTDYTVEKFLHAFLRKAAEKKGVLDPVLFEKTPAHILYFEIIIQHYPTAKFIYLVKDVRDVISSNSKVDWTHSNQSKHAASWCMFHRQYLCLKNKYPDKVLLIRFEDLVMNKESELENICNFLKIKMKYGNTKSIETVPERELEWKSESMGELNLDKVYAWKKNQIDTIDGEVDFITREFLDLFDYEKRRIRMKGTSWVRVFLYKSKMYQFLLLLKRTKRG